MGKPARKNLLKSTSRYYSVEARRARLIKCECATCCCNVTRPNVLLGFYEKNADPGLAPTTNAAASLKMTRQIEVRADLVAEDATLHTCSDCLQPSTRCVVLDEKASLHFFLCVPCHARRERYTIAELSQPADLADLDQMVEKSPDQDQIHDPLLSIGDFEVLQPTNQSLPASSCNIS